MCCTTLYHSHSRRWHALTQITARRSTSTACAASLPGRGHLRYAEGGHSTTGARGAMAINIELGPDEERALSERARGSGRDVTQYVHQVLQDHIRTAGQDERAAETLPIPDDLIDYEAIASCARAIEGKAVPSLDEVRHMLAAIPGAMAHAVSEERQERS